MNLLLIFSGSVYNNILLRSEMKTSVSACIEDEEICYIEDVVKKYDKKTYEAVHGVLHDAIVEIFKERMNVLLDTESAKSCIHKDNNGVYWHFNEGCMLYLDIDSAQWKEPEIKL